MNRKLTTFILLLAALFLSGCITTSFSGNYVLRSGQTLHGDLFVTSGSVTLEENSRVTGWIFLTSGELHIGKNTQVGGDVVLTSGDLYLESGAVVHGDVILSSSESKVDQAPESTVKGNVSTNIIPFVIALVTKNLLLYCVLPLVILVAVILGLGVLLGRGSRRKTQIAPAAAPQETEDTKQKLQKLKAMLDEGLITETDFETKKAEILSKL